MNCKRLVLICCLCAVSSVAQAGLFGSSKGAGKSCGCGESQPVACGPKFPRLSKLFARRSNRSCKPAECGEAAPGCGCVPNAAGAGCTDGCGEGCGPKKVGIISRLFKKPRCLPTFGQYVPCSPEPACGDGIGNDCGECAAAGCGADGCGESGCGIKKPGLLNRLFRKKSRCLPTMLTQSCGCTDNVETATGCGSITQFDGACAGCGEATAADCGEGCGSSGTRKWTRPFRGLFARRNRNKVCNTCSQGCVVSTSANCGEADCADGCDAGCADAGTACGEPGCKTRGCKGNKCKVAKLIRESMTACYARQRRAAIHTLGDRYQCNCHPEIMHAFIYALNDADERVRRKAADEIGDQLHRHRECCSQEIVSALQAACDDCDRLVRVQARQSLRYCQTKCGIGCTDAADAGCGDSCSDGCVAGKGKRLRTPAVSGCAEGCTTAAPKRIHTVSSRARGLVGGGLSKLRNALRPKPGGCTDGCTDIGCTDGGCTTQVMPSAPARMNAAPAKKMDSAPAAAPKAKAAPNAPAAKPEQKKVDDAEEAPAPPPPSGKKPLSVKSVSLQKVQARRNAGRSSRR